MTEWIDVARAEEFRAGEARQVQNGDTPIAVINLDGEYFALEDSCSHDYMPIVGCGLEPDEVIDGEELVCPHHGARFCIRTGDALAPPAYEPLNRFPVRVHDGMVQVSDTPLE